MSNKPLTSAEFEALLDQLEVDVETLHGFVHGDESTTLPLGGTETDSLRRLVAKIKADQGDLLEVMRGLVTEARAAESGAAGHLARMEALAESLAGVSERAEEILESADLAIRYGREAVDAAGRALEYARQSDAAAERAEASANEAAHSASQILELEAKAVTVAYTAPAAVDYDPQEGLMTFAIPAGKPGVQGPPGSAPVSGIVDGGGAAGTRLEIIDGGWIRED